MTTMVLYKFHITIIIIVIIIINYMAFNSDYKSR